MRRGLDSRWRHRRGPRRLHVQIFVALALSVLGAIALGGLVSSWFFERNGEPRHGIAVAVASLVTRDLPTGPGLQPALERRAKDIRAGLAMWDREGRLLASTDEELARQVPSERTVAWWGTQKRAGAIVQLPDGRYFGVGATHAQLHHGWSPPLPILIAMVGMLLAIVTYPIASRITRRLARLSTSLERFGEGDLSARVEVHGHDEVAALARRFNESAAQIEALVTQQRRVLASASHELRAPLSRLRMALELALEPNAKLDEAQRAKLLSSTSADIDELDGLVSDVLLSARAQRPRDERAFERVELDALLRSEAERAGVACTIAAELSAPVALQGEPRMLARLIRNLIENARTHAGGAGIELELARSGEALSLRVLDRGPGVPEADRERIFEPFYRPAGHSEGRDGGVGLGLSLVADIARLHGGRASCSERPGGGTAITVLLPTAARER